MWWRPAAHADSEGSNAELAINGVPIQDDYSETFSGRLARILVTSVNRRWALEAAMETKGLGRSATSPPCEATLEREVGPEETPDGRPGFVIQMMDRKLEQLAQCMVLRIRKGAIPNPKTSVFDALPPELAEESIDIEGTIIQRFGDGYEEAIEAFGRKLYRVPKMDGAFHVERSFGVVAPGRHRGHVPDPRRVRRDRARLRGGGAGGGVGDSAGGGEERGERLQGGRQELPRHGRHDQPSLLPRSSPADADSALPDSVRCVYEIIVSAPRLEEVRQGMRLGIEAAASVDGVKQIHTANYGGKLGKGKIYLHSLFE